MISNYDSYPLTILTIIQVMSVFISHKEYHYTKLSSSLKKLAKNLVMKQ